MPWHVPADAAWMQREMRIVGADVGGQRRGRGQGSERGLPVQLMAEEVAVLLEAGVARVQPARGWGAGPSAPGVERATGAAAAPDQGGSWQSALPGDGERFSVPAAAPDPPTATGEGQVWEVRGVLRCHGGSHHTRSSHLSHSAWLTSASLPRSGPSPALPASVTSSPCSATCTDAACAWCLADRWGPPPQQQWGNLKERFYCCA